MVCFTCIVDPSLKIAFSLIVIFCVRFPGVVDNVMIVPDANKRMARVERLQIRVCSVKTVSHPIIFDADNLVKRFYMASQFFKGGGIGVNTFLVFIYVIA